MITRLAATNARVGESPLWLPDRQFWLWLDLQGRRVHRYDPATATDTVIAQDLPEDLACLARWTPDAALLVSIHGFHRLDLATGATTPIHCPIALPEGTIFNDGKVDRHGALWLGSSDAAEAAPLGCLWRITPEAVTVVAQGFIVSNGPAFAPDGLTAYFADTFGRHLLRFTLDPTGLPTGQTTFATLTESDGYPDGMTTDCTGTLYVGHWDGARLSRWSPDGERLADIPLPALNVTSLSFGGASMRQAIVTTATLFPGQPDDATHPCNGNLLGFKSPTPGQPEPTLFPSLLA